jgi:hypothetical protein
MAELTLLTSNSLPFLHFSQKHQSNIVIIFLFSAKNQFHIHHLLIDIFYIFVALLSREGASLGMLPKDANLYLKKMRNSCSTELRKIAKSDSGNFAFLPHRT